jgi:protein-tyrosine-phosphatase
MAEGLARRFGQVRTQHYEIRSASVLGLKGHPAEPKAVKVMKEIGVDISEHRATPLSNEIAMWADWILVMEMNHAAKVREIAPERSEQVLLLGTFGGTVEIPDPLGGWTGRFRKSRNQIDDCVQRFCDQLPPRPLTT